jgi:hypothetical protein
MNFPVAHMCYRRFGLPKHGPGFPALLAVRLWQAIPEQLLLLDKYWPAGHEESHVPFTVMTWPAVH